MCLLDVVQPVSCPAVTDFVCHNGDCIESHLVCDNKADCADESDEIDCGEQKWDLDLFGIGRKSV